MPAPSKDRVRKAQQACLEAVAILKKHPEFDEFRRDEDLELDRQPHHTTVAAHIRFDKFGKEIFKNPMPHDDYDWPELVGRKILANAAKQGAKAAKLKLTANTKVIVSPSEKGWVLVGYDFLHPDITAT